MERNIVIMRTETLQSQKNKQVASCSCIYYLPIATAATTTNLLITFARQFSGHESESPRVVFCLRRTTIWALTWRSYLQGRTQLQEQSRGTVAPSRLLCSLA